MKFSTFKFKALNVLKNDALKKPLKVLKFSCCMSGNLKIYFLFITYTN